MKVYWSKEAEYNIQEIEDYISRDNSTAAINLTDKIISLTDNLIDFPRKGRIVPELAIEQIREILYKNYRIVYIIKKNRIEVLTVFEETSKKDADEILIQLRKSAIIRDMVSPIDENWKANSY